MSENVSTIRIVVDRTQATQQIAELESGLNRLGSGAGNNARNALMGVHEGATKMGNALHAANDNAKEAEAGLYHLGMRAKEAKLEFYLFELGIYEVVMKMTELVKKMFEGAAAVQTMQASLTTTTRSVAAAGIEFKKLEEFTKNTPFRLDEVVTAFVRLNNLGLNTSERAMKSFGNIAAGTSKTMTEVVDHVNQAALGHIKAWSDFGIKAVVVGDSLKLTMDGVTTTIKNNSNDIQNYFVRMGENKWGDGMSNQAKTLSGEMVKLGRTFEELSVKFGEGLSGAFRESARGLENNSEKLGQLATQFGRLVGGAMRDFVGILTIVANNIGLVTTAVEILATRALLGFLAPTVLKIIGSFGSLIKVGKEVMALFEAGLAVSALTTALEGGLVAVNGVFNAMGGWLTVIALVAAAIYALSESEKEHNVVLQKSNELIEKNKTALQEYHDLMADDDASQASLRHSQKRSAALIEEAQAQEKVIDAKRKALQDEPVLTRDQRRALHTLDEQWNSAQKVIDDNKAIVLGDQRKIVAGWSGKDYDKAGDGLLISGGGTNLGKTGETISGSKAIELLTLSLKNDPYLIPSENKWSGGLTGAHADRTHNTNAVDINYRQGNGAAEDARLNAEALTLQSKGFTVLWKGEVYAGGGEGPTSRITKKGPGDWQHMHHLHAQANGPIALNEVDSRATIAGETADRLQTQADAAQKAADAALQKKKTFNDEVAKGLKLDSEEAAALAKSPRAVEEAKVRQEWYNKAIAAGIPEAEALAKAQEMVSGKDAVMDAKAMLGIKERASKVTEDQKVLQAEIGDILSNSGKQTTKQKDEEAVKKLVLEEQKKIRADTGDLDSQAIKDALAIFEANARTTIEMTHQRDALKEMVPLAEKARQELAARALARGDVVPSFANNEDNYTKLVNQRRMAFANEMAGVTDELQKKKIEDMNADILRSYYDNFKQTNEDIINQWRTGFSNSIKEIGAALAQIFGGKTGNTLGGIFGGLASLTNLLTRNRDGSVGIADPRGWQANPDATGIPKLVDGIKNLNNQMGQIFGNNGPDSFFGKMQAVLGKAGQGAEIGQAITPLMKTLDKKFSSIGAELGGAAGNLIGNAILPGIGGVIGSALGSIAGGVIGGLFKSTKQGEVMVSGNAAGVHLGTATGNDSGMQGAATQAGGSVGSALQNIANQLGGGVGSFGNISIGQYKGDWRVSTIGGPLGGKNVPAGSLNPSHLNSEAEAVAFAVQTAIKMGAITGLTAFSEKILLGAKNIDEALQIAKDFETVTHAVDALVNPMKGAVDAVLKPIDKLVAQMKVYGAGADDFAKVEKYRELMLKQVLDQQLSTLNQFKLSLSGQGSGVTDLNRLNADLAKFDAFKADIAGGKQVDQAKYTQLGQEIFQLAGSVYGTSTGTFQDIRKMLMDSTQGAIDSATKAYGDATVVAIQQQTAATEISNSYLAQIAANTGGYSGKPTGAGVFSGGGQAVNGQLRAAGY